MLTSAKLLQILSTIDPKELFDAKIAQAIYKEDKIFITVEIEQQNLNQAGKIESVIKKTIDHYFPQQNINVIFTSQNEIGSKNKHYLHNIKKVIVVASGKGGVGKSTISASIALALKTEGNKVGILDADIYGPSIPYIFQTHSKPLIENQKFIPIIKNDIQLMSVGFLIDLDTPVAWRGPMATKMLYQMLSNTNWGELDYLIIDMPPGTGDIHLSLLENYNISGVIFITTPPEISMIDVERAILLYKKFNINVIGLIENMHRIYHGKSGIILSEKYSLNSPILLDFESAISQNHIIDSKYLEKLLQRLR